MDFRIDTPLALLIFIPVVAYFLWTFIKHKSDWKKSHFIVFIIRIVAVIFLIFALSSPYVLLPVKEEQVVFLIDRSASLEGKEGDIADFIQESLSNKKDTHLVGIYSFASNVQTEAILSKTLENVPPLSEISEKNDTNIEQALQIASGIVDKRKATRIVLFTDGLETKGNTLEQVTKLVGTNITVDIVPMSKQFHHDVSIHSFTSPQIAFSGEQHQLEVEIDAIKHTEGTLLFYENDKIIKQQVVQLEEGRNAFTYQHKTSEEGLVKYEVAIQVNEDAIIENNKLTSITMVKGAPRILVVTDYENGSSISSILKENAIPFDVISSKQLPNTLSSYLNYNAIIFDNVPGYNVGEGKMAIIEQAVKNFGVGFMMVGSENSFGLGGYFKTPIEKILPVHMEVQGKHELPSLGLMIVLDRSGSMIGEKIELAKEAAARSVELLRDGDTFGFIAFDDRPWEVIEPTPLQNKEEAVNTILSVPVGGGTEIYNSVEMAYAKLTNLNLQRKHIILLTDGQSSTTKDYETLIEEGKKNNITLSTVAIGQDADRNLLEKLSKLASGRFYDVFDATTIPSILSRETSMITRTYIEDNPFYPIIYNAEGWNKLFEAGVPKMNAYIATTAKQTATVVAESEKEDPVLAEWRYGLGRTIAFTSDSTGAWTGDWARWNEWGSFWYTAISRLLPTFNDILYDIRLDNDHSFIITDPTNQATFLDVVVVDEYGKELDVQLEPISASQLKATVKADPGLVFFRISKGEDSMYQAGLTVPYSEEYKLQSPNETLFKEVTSRTKGKIIKEAADVFREFEVKGKDRQNITNWLVLISMLLFFIDITLRRFGWSWIPSIKKGKEQPIEKENSNIAQLLKEVKKQ